MMELDSPPRDSFSADRKPSQQRCCWSDPKRTLLNGKICVVTGANRGIGFEIARRIASMGAHVYLLCRNRDKGIYAARSIAAATGNNNVRWMGLDLSLQSSIHEFVRQFKELNGHVDILINNAATTEPNERTLTPEGVETIFATNVLGPYLLTKMLIPLLESTPHPPARVINMGSTYAGKLDLDDLCFTRRPFDKHSAYRQSKQAIRMLSKHFADYFCSRAQPEQSVKVLCNACMPGHAQTKLLGDLGLYGGQVPTKAAVTPVFMAVSDELQEECLTGCFFMDKKVVHERYAEDARAIASLVQKCESLLVSASASCHQNNKRTDS